MKTILSAMAIAALVAAPWPVWAQSDTSQSDVQNQNGRQHAPGTGGTSKPGVRGLPGSKSGPAVTPSGKTSSGSSSGTAATTRQRDQSGVPGLPGSKSGPAVTSPNKKGSSSGENTNPPSSSSPR
jgi:hypothetical protein